MTGEGYSVRNGRNCRSGLEDLHRTLGTKDPTVARLEGQRHDGAGGRLSDSILRTPENRLALRVPELAVAGTRAVRP
jgi:hypothetical protein